MKHYVAYGSCLASDIEFPELRPSEVTTARWRVRRGRLAAMRDERALGAERIYGSVDAHLVAHADGHRIVVDDTGAYELSSDGRTVTFEPREGAWPDFARAHLLGRVLATAMYLDGWLPLHGSAVETAAGVVALLAPKGYGKSSLALALADAGARLATDDTLPVEPRAGAPPIAWPGVHSLRLRDDTLAEFGVAGTVASPDGKRVVTSLAPSRLMHAPAPLAALYILAPVAVDGGPPVRRTPLPETLGAIAVVSHVKVGGMLGAGAAPTTLERSARIARAVPVHRLETARDVSRLGAVAREILSWHGGAP